MNICDTCGSDIDSMVTVIPCGHTIHDTKGKDKDKDKLLYSSPCIADEVNLYSLEQHTVNKEMNGHTLLQQDVVMKRIEDHVKNIQDLLETKSSSMTHSAECCQQPIKIVPNITFSPSAYLREMELGDI